MLRSMSNIFLRLRLHIWITRGTWHDWSYDWCLPFCSFLWPLWLIVLKRWQFGHWLELIHGRQMAEKLIRHDFFRNPSSQINMLPQIPPQLTCYQPLPLDCPFPMRTSCWALGPAKQLPARVKEQAGTCAQFFWQIHGSMWTMHRIKNKIPEWSLSWTNGTRVRVNWKIYKDKSVARLCPPGLYRLCFRQANLRGSLDAKRAMSIDRRVYMYTSRCDRHHIYIYCRIHWTMQHVQ